MNKAMEDVGAIARKTGTPLENFVLVEGDITLPDLGIGTEDAEYIQNETTSVFHLAAVYDLSVDKETAENVNVEGTRNVNEFAKGCRNLGRYNYVSTCYV